MRNNLINTPLQRGGIGVGRLRNRFNGFQRNVETVETVPLHTPSAITPLKRGVNETRNSADEEFSRAPALLTLWNPACAFLGKS